MTGTVMSPPAYPMMYRRVRVVVHAHWGPKTLVSSRGRMPLRPRLRSAKQNEWSVDKGSGGDVRLERGVLRDTERKVAARHVVVEEVVTARAVRQRDSFLKIRATVRTSTRAWSRGVAAQAALCGRARGARGA